MRVLTWSIKGPSPEEFSNRHRNSNSEVIPCYGLQGESDPLWNTAQNLIMIQCRIVDHTKKQDIQWKACRIREKDDNIHIHDGWKNKPTIFAVINVGYF